MISPRYGHQANPEGCLHLANDPGPTANERWFAEWNNLSGAAAQNAVAV